MNMTGCNLSQFLVVTTFVARCLHLYKYARHPSGESRNYLSRRLSCNFAEMTASTPLRICFLLQIYDKGATATIKFCLTNVYSKHEATNHIKRVMILALQIICAAFHFVIRFAPTEESRVLALDLSLSLQKMIANNYLSLLNKFLYDIRHLA